MKAYNQIAIIFLFLSVLLFLTGCQEPKSQESHLKLSKSAVSLFIGEEITVTVAGGGGDVEVTLPAGEESFTMTSDNAQIVQIKGDKIAGIAEGQATVTISTHTQQASLTVQVQGKGHTSQSITLSPTLISVPVGKTIVFADKAGDGVDVVVTTTPQVSFTLSTKEPDKVKIDGLKATALASGTYTIDVVAGGEKASFTLTVTDIPLTGTWLIASKGQKTIFVPDNLGEVWAHRNSLIKLIEQERVYILDRIDEASKTIWFVDKNVKAGKFNLFFSHIAYSLDSEEANKLYIDGMYLGEPEGSFELLSAAMLDEVGADIDPNTPPEPSFGVDGSIYYELPHRSLPFTVRVFYETREQNGKTVEDLYARLILNR